MKNNQPSDKIHKIALDTDNTYLLKIKSIGKEEGKKR